MARRPHPRAGLFGVLVLAAAILVAACVAEERRSGPDAAPPSVPVAIQPPPRPADAIAMTMEYAYDGDTIRARPVDRATLLGSTDAVRVRIIGIDAPEGTPTLEYGADGARDHLAGLLPEGARVWAAVEAEPQDRYGRRLLHLWTDDGRFVAGELVAAGQAAALRVPPNVTHAALLSALEADAGTAGRGQWSACR
ncbi:MULTISPECIES: thermonuclease family protein [Microbacterium]|uniref:thermonuclease family protein n=1 Tax=Microbacterium TaxID=33882 RepID=UPI000686847C|nr:MULTISPECIES: thermonuclease family protein [Microbacterium]